MIREYEARIWDDRRITAFRDSRPKRRPKRYEIYSRVTPAILLLAAQATWERYAEPVVKAAQTLSVKNQKAIELLDSWIQEDVGDQGNEWASLIKAIDENRTSHRKLFS